MINEISVEDLFNFYVKANYKISTDTRSISQNSLFFALKGENFNANQFASKAIELGASIAIVDEEKYANNTTILFVKNTLTGLQKLANFYRKKLNIPILAITGSNGKTTTKELINVVLSKKYNTLATKGNLNNHIGVPLTILNINKTHDFAIIEMGANHQGEIEALCEITEPTFGLITNIGKAHLEGFKGIEGVKKGKRELYTYLKNNNGKVFINGDDETLCALALDNDKITYGCKKLYDVIGKEYSNLKTVSLKYKSRYGQIDWNKSDLISTQIIGSYNFINCLTACCIGNYFKIEAADIKNAIENYLPTNNRSQVLITNRNEIILDAYNANPTSMKAAIDNFKHHASENKILLLGDMFELGIESQEEHQKIIDLVIEYNFKSVFIIGEEFFKSTAPNYFKFKTTNDCKAYLAKNKLSGKTILIKGSRLMKMEELQEEL